MYLVSVVGFVAEYLPASVVQYAPVMPYAQMASAQVMSHPRVICYLDINSLAL